MSYHVARLSPPYDYRVLIEAYIYAQRADFIHPDFGAYYAGLLAALERAFDLRLSREHLAFDQQVLWGLYCSTVDSLLKLTDPWAGYLECGLLLKKLENTGEPGRIVEQASAVILEANQRSQAAHHQILQALFVAIFGVRQWIVTSEELRDAGFDDSREPDITSHYD